MLLTVWLVATPSVQLVIDPVVQKDAPVQVIAIKEAGDNALAAVIVKNATDKYVDDFDVTWTIFRPIALQAVLLPELSR